MTDFLDRYGEQLARARPGRRRRIAGASRLAIAAPAAAALVLLLARPAPEIERPAQTPVARSTPVPTPTEPPAVGKWTPTLGRPKLGITASIDNTPIAQPVIAALAVLRRPQSERDRKLAGPKLRYAGDSINGIQITGVRALNAEYALVPVTKFATEPNTAGAGICLMGGGGGACAPVESVPRHGVTLMGAGASDTRYAGIVPDGIARVRFTPPGAAPIEAAVTGNFYELRYHTSARPTRVTPPKGWKGPTGTDGKIQAPPMLVRGALEWLDASGHMVKP